MRQLVILLVLGVALLSGCASEQEQVQRTGRSVNLAATDRESRAGY